MYLVSYYDNGFFREEVLDTKNLISDRKRFAFMQFKFSKKWIFDLQVRKIPEQLSFDVRR